MIQVERVAIDRIADVNLVRQQSEPEEQVGGLLLIGGELVIDLTDAPGPLGDVRLPFRSIQRAACNAGQAVTCR